MTQRESITPTAVQYEVAEYIVDLTETPYTLTNPLTLPAGWQPIAGARHANALHVFLMREIL